MGLESFPMQTAIFGRLVAVSSGDRIPCKAVFDILWVIYRGNVGMIDNMAVGHIFIPMAMYFEVNGWTTLSPARVCTNTQMAIISKANTKTTRKMVSAYINTPMGIDTKATGVTIVKMAKENFN